MANLKLNLVTFASAKNLQSTAINPNAAPIATPREGGFTLRNRINFSSLNSSAAKTMGAISTSVATATNLQILEVPKRTLLRCLTFQTVPGSTAVAHAFSIATAHASGAKSAKFEIGVAGFKEASQKVASVKASTSIFLASITVVKATGVIATTFGLAIGSAPYSTAYMMTSSAQLKDLTFPYGGFVTMAYKTGSSAIVSIDKSTTVLTGSAFTGVMEVQAQAAYLPE